MTAFAETTVVRDNILAMVTIRSYNSRYLDLVFHMPESCQAFEDEIKKIITAFHHRGRIEIRIRIEDNEPDEDRFAVDEQKALSFFNALNDLKTMLGISSPVTLDQVLAGRDIILPRVKEINTDLLWAAVSGAVTDAARKLDDMRKAEGRNLKQDLEQRIFVIEESLGEIETMARAIPEHYKARLMEKIAWLTRDTQDIDPSRLAQEAAILSDKSDVSEEIVRLHSHVKQFRAFLSSMEPSGRQLGFMIQEFGREFNTIGSKAGSSELSHRVVALKSVLEQIREQVQNIE